MLIDLSVNMFRQHTHIRKETPQHVQLFSQQFYPLLQSFIFLHQNFDFLLCLARANLRLFSALPHSDIVPLPSASVFIAVFVTGFYRFPRHMMVQHRRLVFHGVHVELLVVEDRAGREGGEGGAIRVARISARIGHVRVGEHVEVALATVFLRVYGFFLDAGYITTSGTVRITIRVLVAGEGGSTVNWLRHIREGGSRVVCCG